MAVYRVSKTRDFTTMSNHHLKNRKLSLKAKGMLSQILSFPDNWEFSLRGLATLSTDGLESTRSAISELEKAGYIIRKQSRRENGSFSKIEYTIFEVPQSAIPSSDSPHTGNPNTANPAAVKPKSENLPQFNTNKKSIIQGLKTNSISNPSINHSAFGISDGMDGMDEMEEREIYREMIMENIEYDILVTRDNADRLDEIVEIMLDAVCSKYPTVRINGEDMSQQVVKSRFLKLNSSHIEYVFETLQKNPSDIRNIRSYLLTTLYNASLTMDNYYTALVNHDMSRW